MANSDFNTAWPLSAFPGPSDPIITSLGEEGSSESGSFASLTSLRLFVLQIREGRGEIEFISKCINHTVPCACHSVAERGPKSGLLLTMRYRLGCQVNWPRPSIVNLEMRSVM